MKIHVENRTPGSTRVKIPVRIISDTIDISSTIVKQKSEVLDTNKTALNRYTATTRDKIIYWLDYSLVFSFKLITESFLYLVLCLNNWLDNYIFTKKYKLGLNYSLNKNKILEIALKENNPYTSISTIQNKYKISYHNASLVIQAIKQIQKIELKSKVNYA